MVNLQGDLPTIARRYARLLAAAGRTRGRHRDARRRIHAEEEETIPTWSRWSARRSAAAACALFHPRPRLRARAALPYRPLCLSPRCACAFRRAAAFAAGEREKLEQLRALEAGMRIDVAIVDTVPLGVDTPEDLESARQHAGEA